MTKQLIIIRGLPGSGKSTLAKTMVNAGQASCFFEADMFFEHNDGTYHFDATKIKVAHNWCRQMVDAALYSGHSVIVSNTFTTKWELEPYFKIATKYHIVPSVILTQSNFKNVHDVPEEAIQRMKSRFEYDISDLFDGQKF